MRAIHPPTSADVDISVAANASFLESFRFDDPTVTTWDFNNKTFRLDIKGNFEQTVPLISIQSALGQITVEDVATRVILINVDEATMQASLVPGEYVYDLIMTDTAFGNARTQLMHGKFTYAQGVTGG